MSEFPLVTSFLWISSAFPLLIASEKLLFAFSLFKAKKWPINLLWCTGMSTACHVWYWTSTGPNGFQYRTCKEFLPEPNHFFEFFLRNDFKWFVTSWYLRNFDSNFLFWIQEKNVKFEWIRLTTVLWLNDIWKRFGAKSGHIYGTYSGHWVLRLIVWLTGINCTGRAAVGTCWFTGTFYPVFHNGFGPVSFAEQNNGLCLFWSNSRVNIALAHDHKRIL